jgi:CspA family cold shock protein
MREAGKIKAWNREKHYGFIQREKEPDVFVHRTGLRDREWTPVVGHEVTFLVEESDRGPRAVDVDKS